MRSADWKRVLQLGRQARSWAEDYVHQNDPKGLIYWNGLGGMCAKASAKLYKLLTDEGFNAKMHFYDNGSGYGHIFVSVADCIVDVTATQYNCRRLRGDFPRVTLMKHNGIMKYHSWKKSQTFNSLAELLDFQRQRGWDGSQAAKVEEV